LFLVIVTTHLIAEKRQAAQETVINNVELGKCYCRAYAIAYLHIL